MYKLLIYKFTIFNLQIELPLTSKDIDKHHAPCYTLLIKPPARALGLFAGFFCFMLYSIL